MEIDRFVDIVETMALQHAYPGYDVRSLRIGLPAEINKSSARLFAAALAHESVVAKLAALRWFWERPGDAKRYLKNIIKVLEDPDEWVRLEAVKTIGRMDCSDESIAMQVAGLLDDVDAEVRKAAAKTCGKLQCTSEPVIVALRKAAEDSNTEVRWKAQKALKQLGFYVGA